MDAHLLVDKVDRVQKTLGGESLAEQLEMLKARLIEEHSKTQAHLLQRIEATRSLEAENKRLQRQLRVGVLMEDDLKAEVLPELSIVPDPETAGPLLQVQQGQKQRSSTAVHAWFANSADGPILPPLESLDCKLSGSTSPKKEPADSATEVLRFDRPTLPPRAWRSALAPPGAGGSALAGRRDGGGAKVSMSSSYRQSARASATSSYRLSSRISAGKRMVLQMVTGGGGGPWSARPSEVADDVPSWNDIVEYTVRGHRAPVSCFADADAMKESVRQAILQPQNTLFDLYRTEGCAQKIARSPWFDMFTLIVIFLNAIWLAIETDNNDEAILLKADIGFQIVEHCFCAYYVFEWLTRFMAFRNKADCMKDTWFGIDTFLAAAMVFETWILTLVFAIGGSGANADVGTTSIIRVIRLCRLSRAARVARLLKSIPELMVIVRGIMVVTRTVFLIFALLLVIMYIFAIIFTQLAKDSSLQESHFPNVRESMANLLLGGILPDMAPWTYTLAEDNLVYAVLFLLFVLLAFVTVMNMLIGVLVEVVGVVAAVEKESNQAAAIRHTLVRLLDESEMEFGDEEGFTLRDFTTLLSNPHVGQALRDVGVDAVGLVDYADFVFREAEKISFPDFLDLLLQLRGGNPAKVSDLVELRKYFRVELARLESTLTDLCKGLVPRGEKLAARRHPHGILEH